MARKPAVLRAFGEAVRRARERAGKSQEDLAFDADLHRNYIGLVERGQANPSLWSIHRIAEAVGVKVRDLV